MQKGSAGDFNFGNAKANNLLDSLRIFQDAISRLERESSLASEFRGRISGDLKALRDDLDSLQRILVEGDNNLVSTVAKLDERIRAISDRITITSTASVTPQHPSISQYQAQVIVAIVTVVGTVLTVLLPLLISQGNAGKEPPPKILKPFTPPQLE